MRNKIRQFLASRGLSAYRMIHDAEISDTTGYKLAADPSYIPSAKVLEAICEAYKIQPGELLEWIPSSATPGGRPQEEFLPPSATPGGKPIEEFLPSSATPGDRRDKRSKKRGGS